MNNKGQALVEFIIILPILIFILMAIIDYSAINLNSLKLENIIVDVKDMYKNKEPDEEIKNFIKENDKDIKMEVNQEEKYINIKLCKEYDYITPGLNKIFKLKEICVERKSYHES